MTDIIVPIDGIDATVDEQEYLADPVGVVTSIREDRRAVSDLSHLYDPAPEYNDLDTIEVIADYQSSN